MFRWFPVLASLLLVRVAAADLLTLTPNHDATLYEDPQGLLANGSGQHLFAGITAHGFKRRALLSFDLSSLPADAAITRATLTLSVSRTITSPLPMTLHRVLSPWTEGPTIAFAEEGGGAPSLPGDATWLSSSLGSSLWQTPGGDFLDEPSASAIVGANAVYSWSSPALARDIHRWLANPDQNHGWLLRGYEAPGIDTTAKRFDSRENDDRAARPSLTIEYTTVPSPGTLVISTLAVLCFCKGRPRSASL